MKHKQVRNACMEQQFWNVNQNLTSANGTRASKLCGVNDLYEGMVPDACLDMWWHHHRGFPNVAVRLAVNLHAKIPWLRIPYPIIFMCKVPITVVCFQPKLEICQHILVKFPNTKFHGNLFNHCGLVTCIQMDNWMAGHILIGIPWQGYECAKKEWSC
jgi:hypothetical protein